MRRGAQLPRTAMICAVVARPSYLVYDKLEYHSGAADGAGGSRACRRRRELCLVRVPAVATVPPCESGLGAVVLGKRTAPDGPDSADDVDLRPRGLALGVTVLSASAYPSFNCSVHGAPHGCDRICPMTDMRRIYIYIYVNLAAVEVKKCMRTHPPMCMQCTACRMHMCFTKQHSIPRGW
jgi:hypothetical protein